MNEISHKLTKNTVFFTGALVIQKILTFGFFIFIARAGGSGITGEYVGALAFTSIFSVFIDLGLAQVLIRETAKNEENGNKYFNNIFTLKIFSAILVYCFVLLFVHAIDLLDYSHPAFIMVYLAGIVMALDSFVLIFHGAFRGLQNLYYESFLTVISKVMVIIAGVIGIKAGLPAYVLIIAVMAGSTVNFIASLWILIKKFHYKIRLVLNRELLRDILKESWPFLMLGLFTSVYSYVDSVLLAVLKGSEELGLYSVASKTLNGLQFIPMALVAGLYPAMSAFWGKRDLESLEKVFDKGMAYLLLIGAPASIGIFVLGKQTILWAYGAEFMPSIAVFKLLLLSMVFVFLTFPIGALLNATGRQRITTLHMGIIMGLNLILNLILIPAHGFMGAGISWVTANIVWFLIGIIYANTIIKIDKKFLLSFLFKVLAASAVMAIVLLFTRDMYHVVINFALGGMVYAAAIWLVGGVKKEEVRNFIAIVKG